MSDEFRKDGIDEEKQIIDDTPNDSQPEKIDAADEERREIREPLSGSLRVERKRRKSNPRRTLLILISVVVVAAIAIVLMLLFLQPPESEGGTVSSSLKLIEIDRSEIERIEVQNEDKVVVYYDAENKTYSLDGMSDDVLEQDVCTSLFTNFSMLTVDGIVVEETDDPALYGLDDPLSTATVYMHDGTERTFYLGDIVPTSTQYYLMEEGDSRVYLAQNILATRMLNIINDYHATRLDEMSIENGQSMVLRERGGEYWRMAMRDLDKETATYNIWRLSEPLVIDVNYTNLYSIMEGVSAITLNSYIGTLSSADKLAEYGLDDPLWYIDFTDANGSHRHFEIGNVNANGYYYTRIDDSLDIYLSRSQDYAFLEGLDLRTLIDTFTSIINITATEAIKITDGTATYDMRIDREEQYDEEGELMVLSNGQPDYLEHFFLDGKEVEESAFKQAYQAIIGVSVVGFVDEETINEEEDWVLRIDFTLNTFEGSFFVEYKPYDVNNYYANRDGLVLQYVRKDSVDKIMPTLKALKDGTLTKD